MSHVQIEMEEPLKAENPSVAAPALNICGQQQQQQQEQQQKPKRKHRRGKPKPKNGPNTNKPYKKANWRFQMPRQHQGNYHKANSSGNSGGGGGGSNDNNIGRRKLLRSRSLLVPYNTNKFLMEEHMAEAPNILLSPKGRTRESSFSVDSDDNYFFSLPEDEEDFLTKEFANVYEKARVERLEAMTKEQLIRECVQIEDRYTKDQGTQRQQNMNDQRIAMEYMTRIRVLEEKIKDLTRENYELRCQYLGSGAAAAAASPPSATAPIGAACEKPTPMMESSSEDSESDSSSSTSSSSSSSSSVTSHSADAGIVDIYANSMRVNQRLNSCSSHSSADELPNHHNNVVGAHHNHHLASINEIASNSGLLINDGGGGATAVGVAEERCRLLDAQMDDDGDNDESNQEAPSNSLHTEDSESYNGLP